MALKRSKLILKLATSLAPNTFVQNSQNMHCKGNKSNDNVFTLDDAESVKLAESITNIAEGSVKIDARSGIPGDEHLHILSFRRQVYVLPPSKDFELQTSLIIPFDGNENRIFLSTDKMECFNCKQPGHIALNFPNPPTNNILLQPTLLEQSEEVSSKTNSVNLIESKEVNSNKDPTILQENQPAAVLTLAQKR
ncbi:unnamed protein product [Psylliodes chrysocephalus]|uniref:Uncharacterized protein n=1 Tax=Psylliodes chrysocephalus TaxID=3402493 RepID=A0A9P0D120_9CUCU|nr:unnamed protein product [Psylliodes chrysocephala]